MRGYVLPILAAYLSMQPLLSAEDPSAPSTDQQALIEALKKTLDCETEVYHSEIPAKARLRINKNGEETLNESLEGFDEMTVIVLSGKSLGKSTAKDGEGMGYRVFLVANTSKAMAAKTGTPKSLSYSVDYREPAGAHGGIRLRVGYAPLFSFANAGTDPKKPLGNLTIRMTTEGEK